MTKNISEIVIDRDIKNLDPLQIAKVGNDSFVLVPFFRAMTKQELGAFPQLLSNGEIDTLVDYLEAELQSRKEMERRNR